MNSSVLEVLHRGANFLKSRDIVNEEASASSEYLLSHILHKSRSLLYLESNQSVSDKKAKQFFELLKLRAKRHPVQYLTGETGFRLLDLKVRPGTLIPRPETEILVDVVLSRLPGCKNLSLCPLQREKARMRVEMTRKKFPHPNPLPKGEGKSINILDVGTGSGNIAISLAKEITRAKVVATDLSAGSIQLARNNAKQNGVLTRISFVRTDLWKGIRKKFDVLVSNPPYLSDQDFKNLQPEVRFEPRRALSGGPDGLKIYRAIIHSAKSILKQKALIAFEVGMDQSSHVVRLLELNQFHKIEVTKDLAGIDRIVSAKT